MVLSNMIAANQNLMEQAMTKMEQNLLLFQPAIAWLMVIKYIGCKNGTRPAFGRLSAPQCSKNIFSFCYIIIVT